MRIVRVNTPDRGAVTVALRPDGSLGELTGDLREGYVETGATLEATETRLVPIEPPVIIGIALNYRRHAEETGKVVPEQPVFFTKMPGSVQAPGAPIRIPRTEPPCTKVDYEGELAVVLGRACRNVRPEEALDYVFGYTIANDVSARDWQFEWGGGQFNRAKSFDTFCPLGPAIVTREEVPNPGMLSIRTWRNEELVQDSHTSDLVFDVPTVISFLSQSTTLPAGTLILTGTPEGVGQGFDPPKYLRAGDTVRIAIEGLGELVNPVEETI